MNNSHVLFTHVHTQKDERHACHEEGTIKTYRKHDVSNFANFNANKEIKSLRILFNKRNLHFCKTKQEI